MKTIALSLTVLLLTSGCETGTRYDKNDTQTESKKDTKKKIDESILNLIKDDNKETATELIKKSYIEEDNNPSKRNYDPENPLNSDILNNEDSSYNNETQEASSSKVATTTNGLNVKSIRVGYHDTYTRLVFDIYDNGEKAKKAGEYNVDYNPETDTISITLNGYRPFSGRVPTFSKNNIIEKIKVNDNLEDIDFKFFIKLKDSVKVKFFDYKNPARLIIDISTI